MYAIFTMRKMLLTSRINALNTKLMQLSQKTQDLATYAANIADGVITPEEAANSPASIFQRQSSYMNMSIPNALNDANFKTQQYMMQYGGLNTMSNGQLVNGIDPTGTTSIPNQAALNNSFYKQAMQEAANIESKRIEAIEKELDQQKLKIDTQLKEAQAELESVEKAEEAGIKSSAPKYSA